MPITCTASLSVKCCDCGIASSNLEIAGQLDGQYVDYTNHTTGSVDRMLFAQDAGNAYNTIMLVTRVMQS